MASTFTDVLGRSSCGVLFFLPLSELIIDFPGGEKANLIFSSLLVPGVDKTLSISDVSTPSTSDGSPNVNSESLAANRTLFGVLGVFNIEVD